VAEACANVSFVYSCVYSATAVRQSSCSSCGANVKAAQAPTPAAEEADDDLRRKGESRGSGAPTNYGGRSRLRQCGAKAISFPLMLARDVGLVPAIGASLKLARENPAAVALWGAIVAERRIDLGQ
jgi:hypothetical protein